MGKFRQFLGLAAALAVAACAAQPPAWSVIDLKTSDRTYIDGNAGRDLVCVGADFVGPTSIEHMRIIHVEIIDMRNGRYNTLLLTPLALAMADADQVMEIRGDPGMDEVILDPSVPWTVSFTDTSTPLKRRYSVKSGALILSVDIPDTLQVHMANAVPAPARTAASDPSFDAKAVIGQVTDANPVILEMVPVSTRIAGIDMRNGQSNVALISPHTFLRARSDMLRIAGDDSDVVVLDPRSHWRIEAESGDEMRLTSRRGYDHTLTLIVSKNLRLVDFGAVASQVSQIAAPPFPGFMPFVGSLPSNTRVRMPYGGRIRFVPGQVTMIDGFDLTNDSPNTLVLSSDDLARTPNRRATVHGDAGIDSVEFAEPALWQSDSDVPSTAPDGRTYRHYRMKQTGAADITLRIQAELKPPAVGAAAMAEPPLLTFVDCRDQPIRLAKPATGDRPASVSE